MTVPTPTFSWSRTTEAQRSTLLAASLGWMLDAFDVMLYSLVLTSLLTAFSMSKSTAGWLNTLTLVASAIGSVLFGVWADRWGRRRMLSASILTYSVFTALCGLSTTIPVLAVCRFLLGLGMGGEWNTGAALVAETWPSAWRGRAMGIVQGSWAIGYALGAVVAGAILPRAGWRWVFFVGILPALITFWIRRGVPEPEIWKEHSAAPPDPALKRRLWKDAAPKLAVLLSMNTFGMFAWWGLFSWIPAYLALPVDQGGRGFQTLGVTSFLVVLNVCGMWPGYILFGILADKFGRRQTIVLYLVLAAIMAFAFSAAREPWAILLTASLTGCFGTGFFAGTGIAGSELFPTPIRSAALGIAYNVARGLSALAPAVVGSIGESKGLTWAFATCAVAYACASVCALWVPETKGTELR